MATFIFLIPPFLELQQQYYYVAELPATPFDDMAEDFHIAIAQAPLLRDERAYRHIASRLDIWLRIDSIDSLE